MNKLKDKLKAVQRERAALAAARAEVDRQLSDIARRRAELENIAFEQRERVARMLATIESHVAALDNVRGWVSTQREANEHH